MKTYFALFLIATFSALTITPILRRLCVRFRLLDVPEDKEFAHPGSVLYFTVDDINKMHESLVARGVAFRKAPHLIAKLPDREVWMAFFDDTEGNTLALMSERKNSKEGDG